MDHSQDNQFELNIHGKLSQKTELGIDSVNMLHFDEFLEELLRLGVTNALYMDMGAGWNYSWYRSAAGKVITLFGLPVPWSHNWIVFQK